MSRGGWLVRLYPARWRRRYEAEYRALLDEQPLSLPLVVDVVAGAFHAHLDPFPEPQLAREEIAMTTRRLQTSAAWLALLLVLPSLTLLSAAFVRGSSRGPAAQAAQTVFDWFVSLHGGGLVLWVGPALALVLGLVAVWSRVRTDAAARADLTLFSQVGLRLLRRPVLWVGLLAAAGSFGVLIFTIDHWFAG